MTRGIWGYWVCVCVRVDVLRLVAAFALCTSAYVWHLVKQWTSGPAGRQAALYASLCLRFWSEFRGIPSREPPICFRRKRKKEKDTPKRRERAKQGASPRHATPLSSRCCTAVSLRFLPVPVPVRCGRLLHNPPKGEKNAIFQKKKFILLVVGPDDQQRRECYWHGVGGFMCLCAIHHHHHHHHRARARRIGAARSGAEWPAPPRIAPLRPAPARWGLGDVGPFFRREPRTSARRPTARPTCYSNTAT